MTTMTQEEAQDYLLSQRLGKHPESCRDIACTLTYRQHLLGIKVSANAMPTRGQNLEVVRTSIREQRWKRDHAAFRRLAADGHMPPQIDGSALREKQGEDAYDIEERKVTIDYNDPT